MPFLKKPPFLDALKKGAIIKTHILFFYRIAGVKGAEWYGFKYSSREQMMR
jgi:hypothetical protein